MLRRMHVLFLLLPVFASLAIAGGKKKALLSPAVLHARTVLVLIDPDAGVSVEAPQANKTAQEDVEKALTKWGRFEVVMDTQTADLIIIVRKGSGRTAHDWRRAAKRSPGDRPVDGRHHPHRRATGP
ncbi:MAG TPA: hypothetical protein VMF66_15495 [Candidatus Acidoferrum sp.]|nr:hypothetical protein [Candidatus Acidoferrum sp.]